jgi:uncharacterized iron-regulated membrane protein
MAAFQVLESGLNLQRMIMKFHRWFGLLVVVQLVAWTVGGLYFSVEPIEEIRGEHLVRPPGPLDASRLGNVLAPGAIPGLQAGGELTALALTSRGDRVFYRASDGETVNLFDATTGDPAPPVDADEAAALARAALIPDASILEVTLLENVPRGHEYRGKPLPAYRVRFDHGSNVSVYVAAATGEITTRRTTGWRIFDFLWMLHIMDYRDRDDFNHPLLTLAASVSLFVLLSGLLVWWQSTPLRRRRRGRVAERRRETTGEA